MIVIHQPYFLPWLGYFAKLKFANIFMIMDDAFFTKGHYIDRAKIVNMNGKTSWLNIPVGQNFNKPINEVEISDKQYISIVISTLLNSYKKARYYQETLIIIPQIEQILIQESNLAVIDQRIIELLIHELEIEIKIDHCSKYKTSIEDATEKLIFYCDVCNDKDLLLGDGSSFRIHDINKLKSHGIKIYRQSFYVNHPDYFQVLRQRIGFEKGLSVIDALFNVGKKRVTELIRKVNVEEM